MAWRIGLALYSEHQYNSNDIATRNRKKKKTQWEKKRKQGPAGRKKRASTAENVE